MTLDVSAEDDLDDICIFHSSYKDITVFAEGNDLHLWYSNTRVVVVKNWYTGKFMHRCIQGGGGGEFWESVSFR